MGDIARYFHTSIYSFTAPARTEVLSRFNAALGQGGVKCYYDTTHEAFFLECPTSLGIAAVADERLGAIIANYIQTELDAADEEERLPNIKRFKEATFVDLNDIAEDDTSKKPAPQPIQARVHLVKVGESEGKRLRLLHLHGLEGRLLERTLVPPSNSNDPPRLLIDGLTCRSVRWTPQEGFIFNGRTGIGQSIAVGEATRLQIPDFHVLKDTRSGLEDPDLPRNTWEHVGEAPRVEQWVQGTGLTRQIEPGERVDIPKDAKKYLASGPANATGRLRVPKGHDLLPDAADDGAENSQEEKDEAKAESDFNALLAGTSLDTDTEDDSASEASSDDGVHKKPLNFSDMLKTGPTKRDTPGDWNVLRPQPQAARVLPEPVFKNMSSAKVNPTARVLDERTNMPACRPSPSQTTVTKPNDDAAEGELPEYGGRFAKVDDIGLTASAANTAQWQSQHYEPPTPPKKSKPVVARSDTASVTGAASNADRSRSGERVSSTSRGRPNHSSRAFVTPARPNPREADWPTAKPVVHNGPAAPRLIDDTSAVTSGKVAMPPGLTGPWPELTSQAPKQEHGDKDDDEKIDERVKSLPTTFSLKRNTMRQKAGKKGKGKKTVSKAPVVKAQLPLPDPPPAPKRKQKEQPPAPLHKPIEERSTVGVDDDEDSSDGDTQTPRPPAGATSIESTLHAFGQLLHTVKRSKLGQDDEEEQGVRSTVDPHVKLVGSIGVLLTRPPAQGFKSGDLTPQSCQKQLNATAATSSLLPRLTTSNDDAAYLLSLCGEGLQSTESQTMYEVWIRDVNGTLLALRVPTQDKMDYTVKTPDRMVAAAYAHFPTHVWDARWSLVSAGKEHASPSEEAIHEFVSSMQTHKEAPSFRAMERVGLLTIVAVLAKRVFTRKTADETLKVSQVQEMLTEAMNDGRHTLQASVLPHLDMVKEHLLWWEASWETDDLDKAGLLEAKVDEMVCAMDAVGLENRGPYEYQAPEPDDEPEGSGKMEYYW